MLTTIGRLIRDTLQNWQQDIIWVQPRCALRCFGCVCLDRPLRGPEGYPATASDMIRMIRSGQFYEWHPHARVLNVMGADPLLDPKIMPLLEVLPEVSRHVRVWTPGVMDAFDWETALRFVREWAIYLPALDRELYREITGRDYQDRVLARLEWLRRRGAQVQVVHTVQAATIPDLADLYDTCRRSGFELRLVVPRLHDLSAEGWAYVRRMRRCKGVIWSYAPRPSTESCLAISPMRYHSMAHLRDVLSQLLARLSQAYGV